MGCGLEGMCFKVAHLLSQCVTVCPSGRRNVRIQIFFYLSERLASVLRAVSSRDLLFSEAGAS